MADRWSSCGCRSDACGRLASLFQGEQRETTLRLVVLWAAVCYSSYGIGSWIINIFEDIHVRHTGGALGSAGLSAKVAQTPTYSLLCLPGCSGVNNR